MKTFKQLREQTGFFDALGNLFGRNKNRNNRSSSTPTSSPAPTPAPSTPNYSRLIYGRDGIEMNPPAYYDNAIPYKTPNPDAPPFWKALQVPTADFARKVTSGEPFKVPEVVLGSSTVFRDPDGLPIFPLPSNTKTSRYPFGPVKGWTVADREEKKTAERRPDTFGDRSVKVAPISPNRYGIPRNPKVAQELSAYRSQQPSKIPTLYQMGPITGYDAVGDLRKDFRTPEAKKAAFDEYSQRNVIRKRARDLAAKNRKEREAAQSAAAGRQVRELGRMPSLVDYASKLRDAKAAIAAGEKKFKMAEIERKGRAEIAAQDAERAQGQRDATRAAQIIQRKRDQEVLDASRADLASAQTTIGSQVNTIKELESRLADLRAAQDRLQSRYDKAGSDNDALTRQLEMLNATVANLETRLQQAQGN